LSKLLYIDLDGVIADFESAINVHPLRNETPYDKDPDTIPGLFRNLAPIKKSYWKTKLYG
jgi:hypothetical protein